MRFTKLLAVHWPLTAISDQLSAVSMRLLVVVFFVLLLLVGVLANDDYGLSWDEKTQYMLGQEALSTVIDGDPWTQEPGRRFHGPVFEIVLTATENVFHVSSPRSVFLLRHFINFLSFYLGAVFLYLLAKKHFRSRAFGLLATLLLVLSPGVFGHAFFNSRDIPALSLFVVCIYTLLLFAEKATLPRALVHAFATAALIGIRMTGILIPVLTVVYILAELLFPPVRRETKDSWRRVCVLLTVYLVGVCLFTVLVWPLLWEQPVRHFLDAYAYMSSKSAGGFFFGKNIESNPWYWVPVWIGINTPLLYTGLFLVGIAVLVRDFSRHPFAFLREQRRELLFLAWFFLPILAIIVLKSGIFDSWRHVFFLYPAFLLIGLTGLRWILNRFQAIRYPAVRVGLPLIFALSLLSTGIWMVRNHPFQYIYFSLPKQYIEGNFELDYWGTSFRQGMEYVLATDDSRYIPFFVTSSPGWLVINILTSEQRSRVLLVDDPKDAKYILDNFRWNNYVHDAPEEYKVHAITAGGIEILSIYRNPHWNDSMVDPRIALPVDRIVFYFE
ncbi:MAG: glycosyltransferase family 39 protein [Candidatus Peregrinibacteria bacterium]|nr:glycosyltransferase family 39 protein [Candidatus Peregrinibacteria bacterium]